MTLLEAVVALVILGLSAVGFLEAFQTTSRSSRDAAQWVQAVSYAEAAMESTKLPAAAPTDTMPSGFSRTVVLEPWPNAAGLTRVTVTVTMPDQRAFTLQRLVRTQ
jgi:type II secretory pathway pseudopilin PulG